MDEDLQPLIDQMRSNHRDLEAWRKRSDGRQQDFSLILEAQQRELNDMALEGDQYLARQQILDETLRIHVREDVPVLQAKMLAGMAVENGPALYMKISRNTHSGVIVKGGVVAHQFKSDTRINKIQRFGLWILRVKMENIRDG